MPIGTGIIYNVGDLILSTVSGSGTAFLETKIAAATSSIVYFDSNARINSASLNSITVGTASYVSGSTSIITNLTASNISASGTGSFGMVGIGTSSPAAKLDVSANAVDIAIFRSSGGLANDKRLTITSGGEKVIFNVSDNSNTAIARAYEFQNAGTASMTINASGSVGIGTNNPTYKLHVVGAVYGTTNGQFGNAVITGTGTGFAVFGSNAGGTGVKINLDSDITRNDLVISASTAYVGIGTSTPGAKLDVNGDVYISPNTAGKNTFILSTNASNDARLLMRSDVTTKVDIQANGASYFNGGNVGIGTSVPGTLFQVFKAANGNNWSWFNGNVGANLPTGFTTGVAIGTNYSNGLSEANLIWGHGVSSNQYFAIAKISGSTSYSEQLRIDINGNVGIGTTVPGALLHVYGATPTIRVQGSSAASAKVDLVGTYTTWSLENQYVNGANNDMFRIYNSALSADAITINRATNNVGIGATNPGALLEISSSTAASLLNVKGADGNGLLFVSGSGNVGIGTTSPVDKLHVIGNTTLVASDATSLGSGTKIRFYRVSDGWEPAQIEQIWTGTTLQGVLAFKTNTDTLGTLTTKMVINNNGNVGIGTTNPSSRLHISGSSSTTITITDDALYTNSISNDNSVMTYTVDTGNAAAGSAAHVFKRFNTELVRIDPSGDVGIGTSVPGALLDVSYGDYQNAGTIRMGADLGTNTSRTNATRKWGLITGYNYTNASAAIPIIGYDSSNTYTAINIGGGTSSIPASPTYISFYTTSSLSAPGAERVRIISDGNVGIGTTLPGALLDVRGQVLVNNVTASVAKNQLTINTNGTNYAQFYDLGTIANTLVLGGSPSITTLPTASISASIMSWGLTSGNVGIGTTSPADKLHVIGNIRINGGDILNWGGQAFIQTIGANDMFFRPNSTLRMILTAAGNLGLGNGFTSPAYLLDVSGSSRFGFTSTNTHQFTGSVSVVGSVTAASFTGSLSGSITSALTASYLTPTNSYTITNLTASNISASGTSIFGNVGIGTTGPSYKLDVQRTSDGTIGYFRRIGATINPALGIYANESGNSVGLNTDYVGAVSPAIAFSIASSEKVRIANDGNVGIGTTSPTTKLYVSGSVTALDGRFISNVTSGTDKYFLDCYGTSTNQIFALYENSNTAYLNSYSSMAFRANQNGGSGGYFVFSGANVGIGTTSPLSTLNLSGAGPTILTLGTTSYPSTYLTTLGVDTSARGFLILGNNGENQIRAGRTTTGGYIDFYTNNTVAQTTLASDGNFVMRLAASGNVGIGTTSPTNGTLQVYNASGNTLSLQKAAGGAALAMGSDTTNYALIESINAGGIRFYTGNGTQTERLRIDVSGSVGIGTTSPSSAASFNKVVEAYDATSLSYQVNSGGTYKAEFGISSNGGWLGTSTTHAMRFVSNGTERMRIASDGNVGIGTAAPAAKLEISGSSNSALLNIKSPISGAILFVSGSGAVGIGTSAVGAFTLQVSGSFGATTKSFIIEHPTKAGKKLMYGSLESPYHGIRLTGRDTLVNGKCKIQLPDYIYKLILHDSVNIQLTGIKCNKTLYIDDINVPENYFTIAYDKTVFESYKTYDFFWDFTAIRADVPELQTEM